MRKIEDLSGIMREYCNLMEEIKKRIEVIITTSRGRVALPRIVACELCYLQLRKVCELIALACLVAHGDLPQIRSKSLSNNYKAPDILRQLENLHPDFYPFPSRQLINSKTGRPQGVQRIKEGYLSKEDLRKLYGECGKFLHRGTLRQILNEEENDIELERIDDWVTKIVLFLSHHQIKLITKNEWLFVLMKGNDGMAHVSSFIQFNPINTLAGLIYIFVMQGTKHNPLRQHIVLNLMKYLRENLRMYPISAS